MKNANGNAFAFIDDYAVPAPNWLERHAETYEALDVAGVAGEAIPSRLVNGHAKPLVETVKVPFSRFFSRLSYSAWEKPLPKTQRFFIYVTCGGAVSLVGNYVLEKSRYDCEFFSGYGCEFDGSKQGYEGLLFWPFVDFRFPLKAVSIVAHLEKRWVHGF